MPDNICQSPVQGGKMDLNLNGKVALGTGGGSQKGFGRGICLTLDRQAIVIKADVTEVPEVKAMVDEALK
jgi:hypothetical protein